MAPVEGVVTNVVGNRLDSEEGLDLSLYRKSRGGIFTAAQVKTILRKRRTEHRVKKANKKEAGEAQLFYRRVAATEDGKLLAGFQEPTWN